MTVNWSSDFKLIYYFSRYGKNKPREEQRKSAFHKIGVHFDRERYRIDKD